MAIRSTLLTTDPAARANCRIIRGVWHSFDFTVGGFPEPKPAS